MADVNGPTIQRKNMTTDKKPTCRVVRAGAEFQGKQGHLLAPGISAQSVASASAGQTIGIVEVAVPRRLRVFRVRQ